MSKWENFIKPTKVAFSDGWRDELDFDNWLVDGDGIRLLEELLEIEIDEDSLSRQKSVGKFAADMFGKTRDGKAVIIENQLHKTDHDHLGKILTYAGGLASDTSGSCLVWMAEEIRDEHRAAIDWLNSRTDSGNNFFAIEIELFRVGDSLMPNLKLVCQPNEWSKSQKAETKKATTQANRLYEKLWADLHDYLQGQESSLASRFRPKSGWGESYLDMKGHYNKVSLLTLWLSKQSGTWSANIYIDGSLGHSGHGIIRALEAEHGAAIAEATKQFGQVEYLEVGNKHPTARIRIAKSSPVDDQSLWQGNFEWLAGCAEALDNVMRPKLENFDLTPYLERPEA